MKSLEQYTTDCKNLGIKARRFAFANNQLTNQEAEKANKDFKVECKIFSNKYGCSEHDAKELAIFVSDNINLGLAY